MIVVSGCPRSGTSLMMLLHKEALGEDRIIGTQWMGINPDIKDENVKKCIDYINYKKNPDWKKEREETKKMNPNGFWECPWTVRGIQWTQNPPDKNKVCKIVSQGVAQSNPQYIDKLILMVRHPWAVTNSHKDLKLALPFSSNTRNKDIGNVSPDMYINVTVAISKWIKENSPDLLLVDFDELIANSDKVLDSVSEFIGEGNWNKAKGVIEPKLKRNTPERIDDNKQWDVALEIHEHFKVGDWDSVIEIGERLEKEKKPNVNFFCPRWGGNVGSTFCNNCKSGDEDFINNLKEASTKRNIDWKNEPCLWECGMNPIYYDKEGKPSKVYVPLTFDKSIQNNHWVESQRSELESAVKPSPIHINKDKSENIISTKECKNCDDFDSKKYSLSLKNIKMFKECFKLNFDINDNKSVRFEMIEDINSNHLLTQQRNACLWAKTLPNFLVKYYNTDEYCNEQTEKIDLVDVHLYLEKIDKTRWYFSISADGGFDLFASIVSSEEGKCLGTVEFSNELTESYPFRETDLILQNQSAKRLLSTGRAIGYGGIAIASCGE